MGFESDNWQPPPKPRQICPIWWNIVPTIDGGHYGGPRYAEHVYVASSSSVSTILARAAGSRVTSSMAVRL